MTLETITNNLRDGYQQLVPGTFQHVDQLMNERRTNEELCKQWFYTSDGELYFLDGVKKTPTLAITRESENLVLRHIDDAFKRFTTTYDYLPNYDEAQHSIQEKDTVLINLTKLRLSGYSNEWCYFLISTTNYQQLNAEEQTLAERVYGQGTDFVENMKMLKNAKITETKISVLNPDYVRQEARNGPVGRASWLNGFNCNSGFDAGVHNVSNYGCLRGVRRRVEAPIGCAQKLLAPALPEMLRESRRFVSDASWDLFEETMRGLYK